jgi:cytochrome P450
MDFTEGGPGALPELDEAGFDHTDPDGAQDIYRRLAASRGRCPVLHSSHHGGFWAFSQFADVTGAANDHVHYTTREGVTVPPLGLPASSVPLTTDPPEHKFYRRALQPYFTPAAVAELEGPIRAIVIELIESFAADGHADLVAELAGPVPCIVIAMILGLDREHWPSFMGWVDGMEAASHIGDVAARQRYAAQLYEFLVTEVERRKTAPRDDLLTAIATMTLDGAEVSDAIRHGMAQLILVTCPVTVQERELQPGDKVLLMFGAANHDPVRFPDPEVFDADRDDRPPHIAFGFGRHRCIGEHLARLEMRVAAEELLRRVPDCTLAPGAEIRMRTALVRGPLSLEVTWEAS